MILHLLVLTSFLAQSDPAALDAQAKKLVASIQSAPSAETKSAAVAELRAFAEGLLELPADREIDPVRIDFGVRYATTAAFDLPFKEAEPLLRKAIAAGSRMTDPVFEAWPIYDLVRRCARTGRFKTLVELIDAHPRAIESRDFGGWLALIQADGLRNTGRRAEVDPWIDRAEANASQSSIANDLRCQIESERALHLLELGLPDQGYLWLTRAKARYTDDPKRAPKEPETRSNLARIESSFWLGLERYERVAPPDPAITPEQSSEFGAQWLRYGMARQRMAERAGDIEERNARFDEASRAVEKALACERLFERERMRCEVTQMRLATLQGDFPAARHWQEQAEKRFAEVQSRGEQGALLEIEIRLAAFAVDLALRERVSVDALKPIVERLERVFEQQLAEWQSHPLRAGGVGILHFDDRRLGIDALFDGLFAVLPRAVAIEKSFDYLMRTQAMSTLSRRLGAQAAPIDRIQSDLCGENGAVLVWLITIQGSKVFLIDRDGIEFAKLPAATRAVVEQHRAVVEDELLLPGSQESAARIATRARILRQILIPEELEARIARASSLTLSGSDLAGWLPFEVLPIRGERPAGLDYALTYASSLPLALALRERAASQPQPSRREIAVVAAPNVAIEGDPLLELDPEMRLALTPSTPGITVRSFVGEHASRATLEANADVTFLHLLTHGAQDLERERSALLVLSRADLERGFVVDRLSCDDVESMRVPPLVLLSACGGMSASDRFGDDGVAHMGGAFFAAGASCVVLARHAIDFRATVELSSHFTRAVAHGASPAHAMLEARQAVAANPEYGHPYFWSLLQVTGLGLDPVFPVQARSDAPDSTESSSRTTRRIATFVTILLLWLILRWRFRNRSTATR